ncbi:hypothetical protein LZ30DRAFT_554601, partial [Colletotrichum cereale]
LLTRAPAPMVQPLPILTPGSTVTFAPIQQSSPMVMGSAYSMLSLLDCKPVSWVA